MFGGIARFAYRKGIAKGVRTAQTRVAHLSPYNKGWYTWRRRGNRMYLVSPDGEIKRSMSRQAYWARRSAPYFASYGPAYYYDSRRRQRYNRTYRSRNPDYRY